MPWLSCFVVKSILLPIVVAILTYLLVDRLGVWKSRREYSQLGVAIIDTLLEEVRNGHKLMNDCYKSAQQTPSQPPSMALPTASWEGMQTIPDQVLLRILETSKKLSDVPFHPKTIRSHTKNYFVHMCANYNGLRASLTIAPQLGQPQQNWRPAFIALLGTDPGQSRYIESTQRVIHLLQTARRLLDENQKRWPPWPPK